MLRDKKSEWKTVTSGVPQESTLAAVMFLIYANDMPEVKSYMSMFVDDTKLLMKARDMDDCHKLLEDLNEMCLE